MLVKFKNLSENVAGLASVYDLFLQPGINLTLREVYKVNKRLQKFEIKLP